MEFLKLMTECLCSIAHVVSRYFSTVLSLWLVRLKCEADDSQASSPRLDGKHQDVSFGIFVSYCPSLHRGRRTSEAL